MSAFLFLRRRDRTSTYLALDAALFLHLSSALLLPVSLKGGGWMKYSEGAVSAQCASISRMCCRMAGGRLHCIKEAQVRDERATQKALRVFSFSVKLICIYGSQLEANQSLFVF